MINFQRLDIHNRAQYDEYLMTDAERGCEYSFTNLFLWGRQKAAFIEGNLALLSQFDRRCVYPFPVGPGNKKAVLDSIIHDARTRGIPCCLTGLMAEDRETLESLYPGQFRFYTARDNFDYVYNINDLADLKGRKFQKKRNHIHRFWDAHTDCRVVPLDESNQDAVMEMLNDWYHRRTQADPTADFHLEQLALQRAFVFYHQLGLEGLVLMEGEEVLAFTIGSRLNPTTFDIHFEKAMEDDGAYTAINQEFARYLRDKYPQLRYLNREDDMGLEGLRKAKLSYCPDHMVEKSWARLWEDEDEH